MRTGKKADLKCLERSPLGPWNADEEEVLVDESNNTDYEETVDPVSDDIATEEGSDFISGTELEPCTKGEEQLISKDTAAYLAADSSPEADVKILDGAFVVQMLSSRTSYTFQDYSNNVILLYIFWTTSECSTVGYCLGRLSRRQLEGQKANGAKVNVVRCYLWHHYLPPGRVS